MVLQSLWTEYHEGVLNTMGLESLGTSTVVSLERTLPEITITAGSQRGSVTRLVEHIAHSAMYIGSPGGLQ